MEQINVTINNNTSYNLTIQGTGPGNSTVEPNSSTSWSSTEEDNNKSLLFWEQENVWYMEGSLVFDPQDGITFDRGDLSGDQNIVLQAVCNGLSILQTGNNESGSNIVLLAPSELSSNQNVVLTFVER